jgi:hypothetical protein
MGNNTTRIIGPSDMLYRARQIWVTGYYINNANSARLRVTIRAPHFDVQNPLVNNAYGGPSVLLIEPASTIARRDFGTPQPLFDLGTVTNRVNTLTVDVTDWSNAAVTYTDLVLILACDIMPIEGYPASNYQNLPYSRSQLKGLNEF